MTDFFFPPDIEEAHKEWGANCGPGAFAAISQKPLAEARKFLEGFEDRRYMNPTQMYKSLLNFGYKRVLRMGKSWPSFGVVFIQFNGPWNDAHVFAQYKHTHWVAVRGDYVFDINNYLGPWYLKNQWEQETVVNISEHQKGTGGYFVRSAYEVAP